MNLNQNSKREIMRKTYFLLLIMIISLILNSCSAADSKQGILSLVSYSKKAGVGYCVYVADGYAYVTNNDGVVIFDVHRHERPRKIGKISTGVTFGIDVENGRAYISGKNGLVIADVNDPENPKKLKEYAMGKEIRGIKVAEPYVYIASNEGLEILDVSIPGKVTLTAHIGNNGVWNVAVCDGIAYLASPINGVEVIDVIDPASPQKITTVAGTKGAWDVHIHEELLYVGCHGAGIKILTLSDRKSPRIVGSFRDDDGGEAQGVWGDGQHLYVADNFGIEVLDVRNPTNPQEVYEYDNVRGAHDIFMDENYVYVAEAKKGLIIFEVKQDQRR